VSVSEDAAIQDAIARLEAAEDSVAMAFELLDELAGDGEWAAARAVAEAALETRAHTLEPIERAELAFRSGAAAEATGDERGAHESFTAAVEADPGHQATLLSLGNLLFRKGDLDEAERTYRTLLARHRDDLDPAGRAEAYYRLGRIRLDQSGDQDRARTSVEKALASLPSHRGARKLLIGLHRADGNWAKVSEHERRILDFEDDADARFEALLELGDSLRDSADDSSLAEDCYHDAGRLAPSDPVPHRRLSALHVAAGNGAGAIQAMAKLASLPSPAEERAALYLEMARLYRDDLEDIEAAVACYHQALDFDDSLLDAFEECNVLFLAEQDWKASEEHHRRMLGRLGRDGSVVVRAALWQNLVELYEQHLGDAEGALVAAEAACELLPGDKAVHEIAAPLFEGRDDLHPDRLRRYHRQYLALRPDRVASLRALRRVELRAERLDAAWLLCARLALAGDVRPDEEAFLENTRRSGLPSVSRPLNAELWQQHIRHPGVDGALEEALALAAPALLPLYAEEPKRFKIKKRRRIAPDTPLLFARVLKDNSVALGLDQGLDAYHIKGRTSVEAAPTLPLALLVGPDMLSGKSHHELAFAVSRTLARLRPGFVITIYVPPETMPWLIRCILGEFVPSVGPKPDAASDAVHAALASGLGSAARTRLAEAAREFVTDTGTTDQAIQTYLDGVDATCDRVGLLFCEDPGVAVRLVPEERQAELLAFSISEDHITLRNALGIAYGADPDG
jgi:tetratricopeptide (TPR) repeat protein